MQLWFRGDFIGAPVPSANWQKTPNLAQQTGRQGNAQGARPRSGCALIDQNSFWTFGFRPRRWV